MAQQKQEEPLKALPKLEDLKSELAEVEEETQKLSEAIQATENDILKFNTNIEAGKQMLVRDIGEAYREHTGGFPGLMDKIYKRKFASTAQLHESLDKANATLKFLKSEITIKKRRAEGLRKQINDYERLKAVELAAIRGMRFFERAEELLKTYTSFQSATAACQDGDIDKYLPGMNYPQALLVFFGSHFGVNRAKRIPMYQTISRAMKLQAFGKPLITARSSEMNLKDTKSQNVYDYGGLFRQSSKYGIEK